MTSSEIQHLLAEVVRLGGAPGAAVALSHEGTRAFAAAGTAHSTLQIPLTSQSRLQLGCIAKLMTAMVALELAAQGRIDLDGALSSYLPELDGSALGRSVRLRHLLTHTSGYRGPNVADPTVRYYFNWEKLIALLRKGAQLFEPGTFFNYEHTESVLLGEIVARIMSTDIADLHRTMILDPLGIDTPAGGSDLAQHNMAEHSLDPETRRFVPMRAPPQCAFWRASLSDLTLSLEDLLKLGEAAAGLDPGRILRRETVSMLRDANVYLPACIGGPLREEIPSSFGFGCAQYGTGVFGHNGSARGQTCSLRYNPSSRLVGVVALNAWRPHVRDMLCRKSLASAAGNTGIDLGCSPPSPPDSLPDWTFAEVTGKYAGALGVDAEVCAQDGQLVCTLRASSARTALRLVATRTVDGPLQLTSDAPQLTLGFSRADQRGARLMIIGLNAYRRAD